MALSVELLLANEDILERTARLGVQVARRPGAGDLTVVCEYFEDVDTVSVGHRMYFDVDHATGKIGGCIIYDYEDVLFHEVPLLHKYLENAEAASDEQRQMWNVRLLYALLATASSFFASKLTEAYSSQPVTATPSIDESRDGHLLATSPPTVSEILPQAPASESASEWIRSGITYLTNMISTVAESVKGTGTGRQALTALARDMLNATIPLRRAPNWAGDLSSPTGAIDARLDDVLRLRGKDRRLTVSLEEGAESLVFEKLRGEEDQPVLNFRIYLRRGNTTLWSAVSQGGRVVLRVTDLWTFVEAGADTLLIEADAA